MGSNFPDQGSNLHPLHWKRGVLTTGPPGKSQSLCFCHRIFSPSASVIPSPSLTLILLPPSYRTLRTCRPTLTIQEDLPSQASECNHICPVRSHTHIQVLKISTWPSLEGRYSAFHRIFPQILGSGLYSKDLSTPVCKVLDVTTPTLIRMASAQAFFLPRAFKSQLVVIRGAWITAQTLAAREAWRAGSGLFLEDKQVLREGVQKKLLSGQKDDRYLWNLAKPQILAGFLFPVPSH